MLRVRSGIRTVIRSFVWAVLSRRVAVGGKQLRRLAMIPNVLSRSVGHEPFLRDMFRTALHTKQGAVIDVGVNAGQTLLTILDLAPDRPYIGFEPQPLPAACIEIFIRENNLRNQRILPIALSDKTGPVPIAIRGSGIKGLAPGTASMVKGFRPESFYIQEILIFAVRGDEVVEALGLEQIAFIKVDVEGAELEVLRGLQKTIARCRPIIIFEVLHHYLVALDCQLDDELIESREARLMCLEDQLRPANYRILHIEGTKGVKEVEKIRPKRVNDLSSTDYVAVPAEIFSKYVSELQRYRQVDTGKD